MGVPIRMIFLNFRRRNGFLSLPKLLRNSLEEEWRGARERALSFQFLGVQPSARDARRPRLRPIRVSRFLAPLFLRNDPSSASSPKNNFLDESNSICFEAIR